MVHAVNELFSWATDLDALRRDPLFFQRCIHESLRLHPASPVAWRTPTENIEMPDGQIATEDDLIILDLYATNRDVEVFGDDADSFNPHRHILRPKVEPYGLTFGTGVHMCTGRDLDGGIAANTDTKADSHQYGIVSQLVNTLLDQGMRPHPEKPPKLDNRTTRDNWGVYPVIFRS
jgi:hypothetical protein